jgi:hypothetical protein
MNWANDLRSVGKGVVCSWICSSQLKVDDLQARLKITPCIHCREVKSLIKHGFLRGYDQEHQRNKTVRAAHVYRSNRIRATGCGRTFSVWIANNIKQLFICANSLWRFLSNAVSSGNKLDAVRKFHSGLSDLAPYRIWRRLFDAQANIRKALTGLSNATKNHPVFATLISQSRVISKGPQTALSPLPDRPTGS